jgi:hypothetical protein
MNIGTVNAPPAPYPGLGYEYELECDIDFFKELKQMSSSSSKESEQQPAADTTPRCLITDDKLNKDHITLECGHKFNYIPLFKEVLFQKCSLLPKNLSAKLVTTYTKAGATNFGHQYMHSQTPPPAVLSVTYNSSYNLETTKLQYNQMKCPYCRSITSSILPYYPYPDVCKVKYVNTPSNLSLPSLSCEYHSFVLGEHGATAATATATATCRTQCIYNAKYDLMLCNKHLNKLESRNDGTGTGAGSGSGSSSPRHKLTTATAPQTRSRVSKNKHQQSTQPNPETENVIISHHNPATASCTFTLLSGPRKGTPCGKPMWIPKTNTIHDAVHAVALCKVHYEKGLIM